MYNEDNIWQDEQIKYVIGKDSEDNDIEVDAIRKESGIWIENGTMLVEATPEWIAENQPVVEPVPPQPTIEDKINALASQTLTLMEV
jgi:hypothetical protein